MVRDTSPHAREGMYTTERVMAWVFAIGAAVLGVIGLLVGFGLVGTAGVDIPAAAEIEGIQSAAIEGSFWDAMVWMLPAVALGVLGMTMARSDHHMAGMMGAGIHSIAYLMALVTLVLGALALLVGFDVFGQGYAQTDGVIWGVAAVASGLVAGAVHATVPAAVTDEDYLVHLVESRVAATRPAGSTGTSPELERGA